MHLLATAIRLEHIGDTDRPTIIDAYDAAIDAASSRSEYLLTVLAAERAARFFKRKDRARMASGLFLVAATAANKWGAWGKLRALETELPELVQLLGGRSIAHVRTIGIPPLNGPTTATPSSGDKPTFSSSDGTSSTDSSRGSAPRGSGRGRRGSLRTGSRPSSRASMNEAADVSTLLAVTTVLQRESSEERVAIALLSALLQTQGATFGALALTDSSGALFLSAAGPPEAIKGSLNVAIPAVDDQAPTSLFTLVSRTRQPVLSSKTRPHAIMSGRTDDPFLRKRNPNAFAAVPLMNRGSLMGVAYVETSQTEGFAASTLELVCVLSGRTRMPCASAGERLALVRLAPHLTREQRTPRDERGHRDRAGADDQRARSDGTDSRGASPSTHCGG